MIREARDEGLQLVWTVGSDNGVERDGMMTVHTIDGVRGEIGLVGDEASGT